MLFIFYLFFIVVYHAQELSFFNQKGKKYQIAVKEEQDLLKENPIQKKQRKKYQKLEKELNTQKRQS